MSVVNVLTVKEKRALEHASLSSRGVVAGVASVILFEKNPDRKLATIINDSPNVVYLALGPVAIANEGIRLNAQGGAFTFGEYTDFPYFGQVACIAVAINSNVILTEV